MHIKLPTLLRQINANPTLMKVDLKFQIYITASKPTFINVNTKMFLFSYTVNVILPIILSL